MERKSFKLMHNHAVTLADEPYFILPTKTGNIALGINLLQKLKCSL